MRAPVGVGMRGAIACAVAALLLSLAPAGRSGTCPSFAALPPVASAGSAEGVAVGEFTSDGYPDVAVANLAAGLNAVSSFTNGGYGNLVFRVDSPAGRPPDSIEQSGLAVGDFDEDGRVDLVAVKLLDATLTLLLGDGPGSFRAHASFTTGAFPFAVVAGDFDGDGHLDAAVANFGSNSVSVFFGDGTGGFPESVIVQVGDGPEALAVADLDFDNAADIVATHGTSGSTAAGVMVLFGGKHRTFSTRNIPTSGGAPSGVAVAPMNGDLLPDLVVSDGSSVRVLLNQGTPLDGTALPFAVGPATPTGSSFEVGIGGVKAGDLDGDGKTDVAVFVSNGQFDLPSGEPAVRTLLGDGAGGLAPSLSVVLGTAAKGLALADLNGDGVPDLIVADFNDGVYVALDGCTPAVPLDLAAKGIEAVQVVQNLANEVPLIEGKRTIVRGYATATTTVANVAARLERLDASGNVIDSVLPINPLGRITVGPSPSRALADDSFRFEIPEPWTHGTQRLRLEVNSSGFPMEANRTNNGFTTSLDFVPARTLKLTLVDYRWQQCAAADTDPHDVKGCRAGAAPIGFTDPFPVEELDRVESLVRRKFPVSAVRIQKIEVKDAGTLHPPLQREDINPGAVELNRVIFLRQTLQTSDPGTIFVWFNVVFHGGVANVPDPHFPEKQWDAIAGNADAVSHEVGHLLGRKHTNCNGSEDRPDPNYPYVGGKIGGPASDPNEFFGYAVPDSAPGTVEFGTVVSSTVGDEMGYCSPRWPSDYSYRVWRNEIQTRPGFVDPTGDFAAVAGTISADGTTALLTSVQRLTQVATLSSVQPGGYSVRMLDASGTLLADHPFTPGEILTHHHDDTLVFNEVFAWAVGTRRAAIVDASGRELASRAISANAPVVTAVAQSGGATLPSSGPVTVSWSASDPDGDRLTASVLYSTDDGVSWNALASGVAGQSFAVDGALLRGTKGASTGRFRVLVSDGVLTADGVTGPFAVPGAAPRLRVATPLAQTRLELGQSVMLEAVGLDPEDGVLDGASLHWTSDLDGDLGSGRLRLVRLGEGLHTLTVTATDSDGLSALATTQVRVTRDTTLGSPPLANAGADLATSEGTLVTLDGSASSDPDGDPLAYSWQLAGAPVDEVVLRGADTATASFVPPTDGIYTLRLTVSDGLNAPVSDEVEVRVTNIAPEVTLTAPLSGQFFRAGAVTVNARFTDPGVHDEHTCRIAWDADQPALADDGIVDETAHTCTATRQLAAGVYSLQVSVADEDGGIGTASAQFSVFDPKAGPVIGAGWIPSLAHACTAMPTRVGPATFAFLVGYPRADTTPFGGVSFGFHVARLEFHSTKTQWLVVTGAKAQFAGTGAVNGVAGYSYLVTVTDGQASGGDGVDRFRIKIWNASGVVYDNAPGAPDDIDRAAPPRIGGGVILIRR